MASFSGPLPRLLKTFNTLGVLPYKIQLDDLVLSGFGCARSVLAVLFYNGVCALQAYQATLLYSSKVMELGIVTCLCIYSIVIVATWGTLYQIVRGRKLLAMFFQAMNSASVLAASYNADRVNLFSSLHMKIYVMVSITFFLSSCAILFKLGDYMEWMNLISGAGWLSHQIFFFLSSLPYYLFVNLLAHHFEQLNKLISNPHTSRKNLAIGIRIYDTLTAGIEHLNSFFGLEILCAIAYNFINAVVGMFFVCLQFGTNNPSYIFYCMFLLSCATSVLFLYSVTQCCDAAVGKVPIYLMYYFIGVEGNIRS